MGLILMITMTGEEWIGQEGRRRMTHGPQREFLSAADCCDYWIMIIGWIKETM